MRLRIYRRDLPLKHVMTVFRGTISRIRTVIVELEQDGIKGYGEAYEDLHLGYSVEDMMQTLEGCREYTFGYALADPVAFIRHLAPALRLDDAESSSESDVNAARERAKTRAAKIAATTAIEMAACDLWGKLCNVPLWRMWRYDSQNLPLSSYTLGLDSLYRIIEKFNEQPDWPLYRVKLGSRDDMEILRELRQRTNVPFRLDVNGCWTYQQAEDYLDELTTLNIELIEQPLHPDDVEGMRKLKQICPIPLIADESCRSIEDIEKCVGLFDGVNLKPIKFGGLNPTRHAIDKAVSLGLKTMIGNTIESSVGASATSQFAPKVDYIYLDGPLLIDRKLYNGVSLNRGRICMSKKNGTGVQS